MYCPLSATDMKTGVFVTVAVNIDGEGKEKGPKRDRGRSGFVEGFDYFGNEGVADYVFVGESDGGDAFNAFEETDAGKEAAVGGAWEVHLSGVSGYYEFGAGAHAGEEHLELTQIGVLGFVQNYAGEDKGPVSL